MQLHVRNSKPEKSDTEEYTLHDSIYMKWKYKRRNEILVIGDT